LDLLKKHPLTFVSLARQVQAEIIAKAYAMANSDQLDIVHIYTNEEDIALPFAQFCTKPVVLTHHDPFRLLVKYKSVMPKYKQLNWISISMAQRTDMPPDTNWVGNIYHGLAADAFTPNFATNQGYVAYLGRIIESKGVHLAIAAAKRAGVKLKIAGKHYAGHSKDAYWQRQIEPQIDGKNIEYVGFVKGRAKQDLLANASALLVPSTFEEPFGMVLIEALACGTPVIGLNNGAINEIVKDKKTGIIVKSAASERTTINGLAKAIQDIGTIDRRACRYDFEQRFTLDHMCQNHIAVYRKLL